MNINIKELTIASEMTPFGNERKKIIYTFEIAGQTIKNEYMLSHGQSSIGVKAAYPIAIESAQNYVENHIDELLDAINVEYNYAVEQATEKRKSRMKELD